ncbi:MAG: efflux RND transporter periplasmic adaptor subunit [Spirochaetales bacterium]|nr:efflux RND transporter periplasmic adaptor subunit [Spirochaetales bacterium]
MKKLKEHMEEGRGAAYEHFIKHRRKMRFVVLAVLIAVIVGGQFMKKPAEELEEEMQIRPAKVMELKEEEHVITRVFPGRVKASQNIDLTFDVPGRLMEFQVLEGEELQKGDLIARLEPGNYQSNMNAAKAQYEKAELDYNRSVELFEGELIAETKLEFDKVNYDVAKSAYETARRAYEDTFIYAPYDGVVASKYVNGLIQVSPGMPIVNYQSLNKLDLVVDIPESMFTYLPDLELDAIDITAHFADAEKIYPLEVKEFSTVADVRTKTYSATMTMDSPDDQLVLSGMTATVTIEIHRPVEENENTFYIPSQAVIYDVESRDSMVWVVDENKAVQRRLIKTGSMAGDQIQITEGLEMGEIVVVAGAHQLSEGQIIRFYNEG